MPEETKWTLREINEFFIGLVGQRNATTGEITLKGVSQYDLSHGQTEWNVGVNIKRMRDELNLFQEKLNACFLKHKDDKDDGVALKAERDELWKIISDIKVLRLKAEVLQKAGVKSDALSYIQPIVDGEYKGD